MISETGMDVHCSLKCLDRQMIIGAWQLTERGHWLMWEVLAQVVPIDDCAEGPCIHFSTEWHEPASTHDVLDSLLEWQ